MGNMRIIHLVDMPEALPTLAEWFVSEWEPWYGPAGEGDALADLAACRSGVAIPLCLVAVDDGDQVMGTASLKSESVGSEHYLGPWLAALLVKAELPGKGVGSALVAAIENEARRLGLSEIFCSADASAGILERRGWQSVAKTESLRGPISVYRLGGLLK